LPLFHSAQIPPPKDWQEFEELCADLWQEIFSSNNTELNGRTGQPQHGVDVFGQIGESNNWFGVQCKGKDGRYGDLHQVTEKELTEEVNKAKNFKPKLTRFILATTAPNDAKIQEIARKITVEHQECGLFTVQVKSWDEIHREIAKFNIVIEKYYPTFASSDSEALYILKQATSAIESATSLPNSKLDDAFSKQIDSFRDLLNKGQQKTALHLLTNFKGEYWKELSNYNQFRVETNIAACHLNLGDEQNAALYFINAQKLEPNDEKALCNLVVAHHLLGDNESANLAAVNAVSHFPNSPMANRLKVASTKYTTEELPELGVPKQLHHLPEICFAIGQAYLQSGRIEDAIDWLKKGYDNENGEFEDVKSAYASALLQRLYEKKHIAIGKQLNNDDRKELELIDQLFSNVWNCAKEKESIALNIGSVTNLLLTKFLLNDIDSAISIAKEAIEKNGNDEQLLKHATFLALDAGKFSEAISLVKNQYDNAPEKWALLYIETLARDKQHKKALEIVQQYLLADIAIDKKEIALGIEVKLLNAVNDNLPEEHINYLLQNYSNSIPILLDLSIVHSRNDDVEKAVELALSAKSLISAATDYYTKLNIADELFSLEQYKDASALYEELVVEYVDSEPLRKLIDCYYNCGYRKKLIELINALPETTRKVNFYRRYAAAIFEVSGLYNEAITEIELYISDNPTDLRETLHWFGLCLRIGREDKIESHLQSDIQYQPTDKSDLMRLAAFICDYKSLKEGIFYAANVLLENYNDADVNMAYIQLFMSRDKDDRSYLEQEVVTENSLLTIENDKSELKSYFISNQADFFPEGISLTHPISKFAQGKKKGDFFNIKSNPYITDRYKVASITSLPVFLFQKSMGSFSDKFPEYDKPFWKIDVGGAKEGEFDFTNFFKIIDGQKQHTNQVLAEYETKPYPVCFVAKLLGQPMLDVWVGMQADSNERIFNCVGTSEERQFALDLLETNNTYIVDPLTLFNLYSLNLLEIAETVLGQLGVTQSCIDFYKQLMAEQQSDFGKRSGTIGKTEEGYFSIEKSDTDTQIQINNYQLLLDWISDNCKIVPAIEKDEPNATMSLLSDILQRPFYDALVAANGGEYHLLTEDLRFRQLSKLSYNIEGVWLQPLLIKARNNRVITTTEYADYLAAFAMKNLYFTSIDSESLAIIAEKNNWQVSDELVAMIATLGDNDSDISTSFRVAINFLFDSLNSKPSEQIINAILNGLTRNYCRKNSAEVVAAFILASKHLEYLMGKNISRWYLNILFKWCQGHFITHVFFK